MLYIKTLHKLLINSFHTIIKSNTFNYFFTSYILLPQDYVYTLWEQVFVFQRLKGFTE